MLTNVPLAVKGCPRIERIDMTPLFTLKIKLLRHNVNTEKGFVNFVCIRRNLKGKRTKSCTMWEFLALWPTEIEACLLQGRKKDLLLNWFLLSIETNMEFCVMSEILVLYMRVVVEDTGDVPSMAQWLRIRLLPIFKMKYRKQTVMSTIHTVDWEFSPVKKFHGFYKP